MCEGITLVNFMSFFGPTKHNRVSERNRREGREEREEERVSERGKKEQRDEGREGKERKGKGGGSCDDQRVKESKG